MKDEFFDLVDERVTDDFLEQQFAQEARETTEVGELPDPLFELMVDVTIGGFNRSIDDANIGRAALCYRLLNELLDSDEEVREAVESAQQQHPLEGLFGGAVVMGSDDHPFE